MAVDRSNHAKNTGSGYSKLPDRLAADGPLAQLTSEGVAFKVYTTTERNAIADLAAGDAGLCVYDTTLDKLVLWNGAAWRNADGTALA